MRLVTNNYWTILINLIVEKYFADLLTTCIIWPKNFDFNLDISANNKIVWLQINPLNLNNTFENNIYNFSKRDEVDNSNDVFYNDLTKKLIAAIEQTHCEGFIAFQDDIPKFARAFQQASIYSIWRSLNNKFLFVYSKDEEKMDYFKESLFQNQFNILVIEASTKNSITFDIKTNKFVGQRSQQPEKLIDLSTFYALNQTFVPALDSFLAGKLLNLQGREITVGAFDYRPFVAVDFERNPLYYDQAADNPSHLVHIDGAEPRTLHIFCEIYNCTLQFDTSEKQEWGFVYSNYSAFGLTGMILDGSIEIGLGAMFPLYSDYTAIDFTVYLGRSGITCLVPAASALASLSLPLHPFAFTLWLAVIACVVLEAFVLSVTYKFEQTTKGHPKTWWSSLKFGLIITLKLFINQGSAYLVQSHTMRTFLFACYVTDIILTSVYGGGLAAVLTLPTFGESADSVERLVKHNLTWTGTSYAWLEPINTVYGEQEEEMIYKHLINNFVPNSVAEMRTKAQTDNMGFIVEHLSFGHFGGSDFFTPQALERLKLMVDDIYSLFTLAIVSRLWPHLEKYNNLVLQWHSSGLDKFWEWKSTAEYLNVNQQNQVEASKYNNFDLGPVKLNIKHFAGLLLLWIAGIILSIVAFVVEMIWFKWMGKEKKDAHKRVKKFAKKSLTAEDSNDLNLLYLT